MRHDDASMIKVFKTSLPGVLKIQRKPLFEDHRGIFAEIYRKAEYFAAGITNEFIEQDIAFSRQNVLRGLHGDSTTWKLVSCLYGELYLAVLNYDTTSPFFGKWEGFTLTPRNCIQILIPPMHANGHLIKSEWAMFHYNLSDNYTDGKNQFTVMWNDPRFNVVWPLDSAPILSDRDKGPIKK